MLPRSHQAKVLVAAVTTSRNACTHMPPAMLRRPHRSLRDLVTIRKSAGQQAATHPRRSQALGLARERLRELTKEVGH
jgi:hypothetical protein